MKREVLVRVLLGVTMVSGLVSAAMGAVTTGVTTGPSTQPMVVRLWEGDAPGAQGSAAVDVPTLTVFLPPPETATGAAFIVCPGGGYSHLADHEGRPVAEWMNKQGIAGFVLKYRLGPKYHHPVEMEDVQRAIRLVRSRADEWKLDPKRIGVIGFSAGGHLASTAATHFDAGAADAADAIDRVGCRPDLAMLIYPVITMTESTVHAGSRKSLLGDEPTTELMELMSSERQVTAQTPPCFLVHTADDRVVPVENSLMFAQACRKNHVPVELHVFEHGPHGFGLGEKDPILATWPGEAELWLRKHGFGK